MNIHIFNLCPTTAMPAEPIPKPRKLSTRVLNIDGNTISLAHQMRLDGSKSNRKMYFDILVCCDIQIVRMKCKRTDRIATELHRDAMRGVLPIERKHVRGLEGQTHRARIDPQGTNTACSRVYAINHRMSLAVTAKVPYPTKLRGSLANHCHGQPPLLSESGRIEDWPHPFNVLSGAFAPLPKLIP